MKCPKCSYLGFESSERCRNCGYEFSLAEPAPAVPDVLIHADLSLQALNADLPLADVSGSVPRAGVALDLDRLIGVPLPRASELPLFGGEPGDESPGLIRTSSRPRPPLAVRRATPEVLRARPNAPRPQTGSLALEPPPMAALGIGQRAAADGHEASAAFSCRALAAVVDLIIVFAVDAGVLYFTLRLCGLPFGELLRLPVVPLAAFLLLLNGGYCVAFTAVGGQSIGKMALGIKVVDQENRPVAFGRATLRALVCLASALPFGLGFLPAVLGRDGRALHDRLAHTRVIKPASL